MGYKILLVDDERDALDLLAREARRRGHVVVETSDGAEALAVAVAQQPDAIILDIMMPGVNGRDVLPRIRSNPVTANTPVVVVTGRVDEFTHDISMRFGANDYFQKPFDVSDVFACVEDLLIQRPASDRRRVTRFPVAIEVDIAVGSERVRERATSLSAHGLFVKTSRRFDASREMFVTLHVAEGEALNSPAHIVYVDDRQGHAGIGLVFRGTDETFKTALDRFLASLAPPETDKSDGA